jgi:hypothetical protein
VCVHSGRGNIDAETIAGVPAAKVAAKYGISKTSLLRHKANHMGLAPRGNAFRKAVHDRIGTVLEVNVAASDTVAEIAALRSRANKLCIQAETSGDARVALLAIRELTRLLELQGRMTLEASQGRASDISAHPIWHQVSADVLNAIAPCAECTSRVHSAVAARLGRTA